MYLAQSVGNMVFRGSFNISAFEKRRPGVLAINGSKAGAGQTWVQTEDNRTSNLESISDITVLIAALVYSRYRRPIITSCGVLQTVFPRP